MRKCYFWTIGIALLLVIMWSSFIYYSSTDIFMIMSVIGKKIQLSKSKGKVLKLERQQVVGKPKPLTGMWTVNSLGRMGNFMGEYATLYALAKMNGRQAYILPEMHSQLGKIFKIRLPVIHKEVFNRIQWKHYELHDWMSDEYRHIEDKYVSLDGWPCSFTFYHHIKHEILREFTFHDFIKEESNAYLEKIRGDRKNVTFVGVHVRRGDYVHFMPNTWKGVVADKGYLHKATDYFRKKYQNPLFVVTSNGMDWCKENIDNSLGDVHFAGDGQEGSPGRDFALLAHCNHTIMTIGTFGIWAAYLVGGETIYLTNYTLPDSPFLKVFKYEAAFLPEWIGIPADLSPLLNNNNTL
ncbi:galactoside alpha-(1,2)-fucosyltransferase 2-like [Dendropsophus ebraccatus]|uniref:galactoside alpha-(1,2)-fucosyltransferase 2-like n=1 Tax=Dendropsophus ebraccatus TaxID=150705 RepID=UPI003831F92E